jgi:hypothetical protein
MKGNITPFGQRMIANLEKGDLIYWSDWRVVNEKLKKCYQFGVFLKKKLNSWVIERLFMPLSFRLKQVT